MIFFSFLFVKFIIFLIAYLFFVSPDSDCEAPFQSSGGGANIIGGAWMCPGVRSKVLLILLFFFAIIIMIVIISFFDFLIFFFFFFRLVWQLEVLKWTGENLFKGICVNLQKLPLPLMKFLLEITNGTLSFSFSLPPLS